MRVKIEEKHSLPLISISGAGGRYALLDTGCDNTIVSADSDNIDAKISVVGFGGDNKWPAEAGKITITLIDENDVPFDVECNAYQVSSDCFKPMKDNDLSDVIMILGANFFNKYNAKIDFENKILTLND